MEASKVKFKDGIRHWLYNVKRISEVKENSFARYDHILRSHLKRTKLDGILIGDIKRSHAEQFVAELVDREITTGEIASTIKLVKMYFEYLLDSDIVGKNPFRRVKLPKDHAEKKPIEIFSSEEMREIILESRKTMNGFLVELALYSGLREGELLALDYSDFYDGGIQVSKTYCYTTIVKSETDRQAAYRLTSPKSKSSNRFVPLPNHILPLLNLHRKTQADQLGFLTPYVFATQGGNRLDKSNFMRMYKRLLKRAGVPYRKFHTTRHTYITNCVQAGIDLSTVQELAGHSSIEQTRQYTHIGNLHKREAVQKLLPFGDDQCGNNVGNEEK